MKVKSGLLAFLYVIVYTIYEKIIVCQQIVT
jgi:hypothetical protein